MNLDILRATNIKYRPIHSTDPKPMCLRKMTLKGYFCLVHNYVSL